MIGVSPWVEAATVAILAIHAVWLIRHKSFGGALYYSALVIVVALFLIVAHSSSPVVIDGFGVLMLRGSLLARIALIATCTFASFGWLLPSTEMGLKKSSLLFFLVVGLVVGIWCSTRLFPIKFDAENTQVYFFDLWWPPFLIWLTLCATALTTGALVRGANFYHIVLCSGAAAASVIGLWPARIHPFADPQAATVWNYALVVLIPTSLVVAASRSLNTATKTVSSYAEKAFLAAALITGVTLGTLHNRVSAVWGVVAFSALLVVFSGPGILRSLWKVMRMDAGSTRTLAGNPGRHRTYATLCSALIIIAGVAGLVYVPFGDKSIAAWAVVLAAAAIGDLFAGTIRGVASLGRSGAGYVFHHLPAIAERTLKFISRLVSFNSFWAGAVTILAGIAVLIALSEIPNAGKCIIEPFKVTRDNARNPVMGEDLADRVVNALNEIKQLSRPERVFFWDSNHDGKESLTSFRFTAVDTSDESVKSALMKSNDLQIGPVRVPLSLFISPVQEPMRALLRVRRITGSMQQTEQGYLLMAGSSDGQSWQEMAAPSPGDSRAGAGGDAPAPDVDAACERLALRIAGSEPTFADLGMSQSWNAYVAFRNGMKKWRSYVTANDLSELLLARDAFHEAFIADQGFSLAYYYYGLSLLRLGETRSAISAFRDSVAANARFVGGSLALAYTLFNFEKNYQQDTAAARGVIDDSAARAKARKVEAARIWRKVLNDPPIKTSISERRAARAGLCLYAFDAELPEPGNPSFFLSSYYCALADAENRGEPGGMTTAEKTIEGGVLSRLGRSQLYHGNGDYPSRATWNCGVTTIASISADQSVKRYLFRPDDGRAALAYLRRAIAVSPETTFYRCLAANIVLASSNDPSEMNGLSNESISHTELAFLAASRAGRMVYAQKDLREQAAYWYKFGLAEYEQAIELDPTSIYALNMSGYTFWEWYVDWRQGWVVQGPTHNDAISAERHARDALKLSAARSQYELAPIQSTLAEVLISDGRYREAIEVLETLEGKLPQIPVYNEIRWELAMACQCSGRSKDASNLLSKIIAVESRSDFAPFSRLGEASLDRRLCVPLNKVETETQEIPKGAIQ
jgi:tetratricopeptide (TPR) repeat protein